MRFSTFFAVALPAIRAFAAPVEDLGSQEKRAAAASVSDVATVGYATLNGGYVMDQENPSSLELTMRFRTTGGKGGATVTVSTLAALTSAIAGDTPSIVIVSGTITGAAQLRPGSNKSIIGKDNSASQ